MSHFSTIKTELRNLNMVRKALSKLGYEFQMGGAVPDYSGQSRKVDIVVQIPGQRSVGFQQNPQTGIIELVGDWWGGKVRQQEFVGSLKCIYAREQVLESLEQQGVDISKVKEIEEPDGSIVFEVPLDDSELQTLSAG